MIKLADSDYLDCPSIPDLFHFQQTLAQKAGCYIGKAWHKSQKALIEITKSGVYYSKRKPFEDRFLWQDLCKRRYRKAMEGIHQSVHAFDQNGRWMKKNEISKIIKHSITQVEQALIISKALPNTIPKTASNKKGKKGLVEQTDWEAIEMRKLEDGLKVADIEKLYKQIPAMAKGVQHWQQWTMQRLDLFVDIHFEQGYFPQASKSQVKACLLFKILPWVYWQTMRRRLSATTTNQQLKSWYLKMIQEAQQKVDQCAFIQHLTTEQYELCFSWASQICRTFQRSSSQVEGRNGYLAFVHKANRGIPKQRLKVLTVVHNFDIRGVDHKTPVQRLFKRDFPDLFEFILQDVTSFSEPRKRKRKPLIINSVRA